MDHCIVYKQRYFPSDIPKSRVMDQEPRELCNSYVSTKSKSFSWHIPICSRGRLSFLSTSLYWIMSGSIY